MTAPVMPASTPTVPPVRPRCARAPGCGTAAAAEPLSAVRGLHPSPLPDDVVRLVEQNFGLVREVLRQVGRRLPAHVDRADLFGAGAEALLDAARRFEPGQGATFPAFAAKRVRGAMLDQMRRWDWVARSVRAESHKVADTVEDLEAELGRNPTAAEIATALGTSVERLAHTRSDSLRATVLSLDAVIAAGSHRLPTAAATPPDVLLAVEVDAQLHEAVDTLPDRERYAISGYYLGDRPMRDLALELGVGESRVSQLCKQGLKHLRENLTRYVLDDGPPLSPGPG